MAKSISRSKRTEDIVSVGTLTKIGDRIARSARSFASSKRAGRSAKAIRVGEPKVTEKQIEIHILFDTDIAPEAPAYEWGSGLHSKDEKRYIDIYNVNTNALVFPGTNAWEGQTIVTNHVNHPGVAKRPFLEPAKESTRQKNLEDISAEANRKIKLIVRGMARKV